MELKLFGKNAGIYIIGNIFLRGSAFLIIPIYIHSLSISDYGLFATLLITVQFLLILMTLGMRNTLVRFTKEYQLQNQIAFLFGTSFIVIIFGGFLVTTILLLFFIPLFRTILHSTDIRTYIILTCISASIESLFIHVITYYRAINEAMKYLVISICATTLLFFLNAILLLKLHSGINGALMARIVAYGLVLIYSSFRIFLKIGFGFSISILWKLIKFGFPLIFSMSGQFIMGNASIYFISYFSGLESVAIYSLGLKFASVLGMIVILPFQLAYEPFIFANLHRPGIKDTMSRLFKYMIVIIVYSSFIILMACRILLPIIAPPEYSGAYLITLLIIPALIFMSVSYYGECLLNIKHKTYITGIFVALCTLICLLLNFILVPQLNSYGAIISLFVAYSLMGSYILFFGLKYFPLDIDWKKVLIIGITFFIILSFFILLHTKSYVLFYLFICLSIVLSLFALYKAGFVNENEKTIIMRLISQKKFNI